MPRPEDQFHVGIVVTDPEAVKAELTAVYGYEWTRQAGAPMRLTLPSGDAVLEVRCAYSLQAPRVEIIGAVPGTMWEPAGGSLIHHVGYWSDDVAADAAALEQYGYECEALRRSDDGSPQFAFYRGPRGFRVELLTRAMQPSLERMWAR